MEKRSLMLPDRITASLRSIIGKCRTAVLTGVYAEYCTVRYARRAESTGLFDPEYYRSRDPKISSRKNAPFRHYVRYGAQEGRDPSSLFQTAFYCEEYPDVSGTFSNPLIHYLKNGKAEGRFKNGHEKYLVVNGIEADEQAAVGDRELILRSGLFDADYYLKTNPAAAASGMDPLRHFLYVGAAQGFGPFREFDVEYYEKENADVIFGEINPLVHYLRYGRAEGCFLNRQSADDMLRNARRIDILTTPQTQYVAKTIKTYLDGLGRVCEIFDYGYTDLQPDVLYISVCPQFLKKRPLHYIAVQLEQVSMTEHWSSEEYKATLRRAIAVLDYSLVNIEYLNRVMPELAGKLYYFPISVRQIDPLPQTQTTDVLFYGDPASSKRQACLEKLRARFPGLTVCSSLFGEEMTAQLRQAKVLVNIHYYDPALLETTRICEALSAGGCVIVSEHSRDRGEDERFADLVDFVDEGDIDAMLDRVGYWLSHERERTEKLQSVRRACTGKVSAGEYFFKRLLLAYDLIDFDTFYSACGRYVEFDTDRLCVNMPESVSRRKAFERQNRYGFCLFPALRHKDGWRGCAYSYKFIFTKALEQGFEKLLVCEDDVVFPEELERKLTRIADFLARQPSWDLFSGLVADVNVQYKDENNRIRVTAYRDEGELLFAKLNRVVSTVFNIYNRSIFPRLAGWDREAGDARTNTIDRYMGQDRSQFYTSYPFLVRQDGDICSTLWGGKNGDIYSDMISQSEQNLLKLIRECGEELP